LEHPSAQSQSNYQSGVQRVTTHSQKPEQDSSFQRCKGEHDFRRSYGGLSVGIRFSSSADMPWLITPEFAAGNGVTSSDMPGTARS
jgi:hypothetical protein